MKLIFEKYGQEHCAVVGGFSTFQARSAFAEIAKVLGVAEREVRRFTDRFPWNFGSSWEPTGYEVPLLTKLMRESVECRDLPLNEEPYKTALETAQFLDGMPRYPKMHPCGVVLSRQPMRELTPTFVAHKGYSTTHFDMDAVEAVGLVKMDILAQGGLAAMRDVKAMLEEKGIHIDLEKCVARDAHTGTILRGDPNLPEPWQDPSVWEMIASGNAAGDGSRFVRRSALAGRSSQTLRVAFARRIRHWVRAGSRFRQLPGRIPERTHLRYQ